GWRIHGLAPPPAGRFPLPADRDGRAGQSTGRFRASAGSPAVPPSEAPSPAPAAMLSFVDDSRDSVSRLRPATCARGIVRYPLVGIASPRSPTIAQHAGGTPSHGANRAGQSPRESGDGVPRQSARRLAATAPPVRCASAALVTPVVPRPGSGGRGSAGAG